MSTMSRTPQQRWSGRRTAAQLAACVAVACGRQKADLVIRQARIFHLTCGQFETADIAVAGETIEDVSGEMTALLAAAAATGCVLPEPFQALSFLPLPVIPHLRLTDRGLVAVDRFAIISEP